MLPQEKTFLKIAMIISLIGMLLLVIITEKASPKSKDILPISAIEEGTEGSLVAVAGTIKNLKDTPVWTIITLEDNSGSIKVIANKKGMETKLRQGAVIEVSGKIKEYREEKEIEAERIRILAE